MLHRHCVSARPLGVRFPMPNHHRILPQSTQRITSAFQAMNGYPLETRHMLSAHPERSLDLLRKKKPDPMRLTSNRARCSMGAGSGCRLTC